MVLSCASGCTYCKRFHALVDSSDSEIDVPPIAEASSTVAWVVDADKPAKPVYKPSQGYQNYLVEYRKWAVDVVCLSGLDLPQALEGQCCKWRPPTQDIIDTWLRREKQSIAQITELDLKIGFDFFSCDHGQGTRYC